jgi:hypothetical protein
MWTTPPDFTAGNILTAAQLDILSQDLLHLFATPQYRCSVYHSTTQTITAGNNTPLSLDTEEIDTASMHSTSVNNSRITIPSGGAGVYLIFASTLAENTAATPQVDFHLRINGSAFIRTRRLILDPGVALYMTPLEIVTKWPFGAGDYVEMIGQATTANVTFGSTGATLATRLEVIGPLPAA